MHSIEVEREYHWARTFFNIQLFWIANAKGISLSDGKLGEFICIHTVVQRDILSDEDF